jgi:Kef-type K+ transport system membrane component KefB
LGHIEPSALFVLLLAIMLLAAKLGGEIVLRLGQPPVLGEIIAGIVLGNLGWPFLEQIKTNASIAILAQIGVLILLFEVGLESTLKQMLQVGGSSLLVAILGVVTPFALGWLVSSWFLPTASFYVHAFIGASLTATSVGITARVLKDLKRSTTNEARIILGAAVIDDVLGLIVLAVVGGMIGAASSGGSLSLTAVATVTMKAAVFLIGSLALGTYLSPRILAKLAQFKGTGVLLIAALSFCFFLAWLANVFGLAPIVGAFAAGLILENTHYEDFVKSERQLEELVRPISTFLTPVFFVLIGMTTQLRTLTQPGVFAFALVLTFVAIVGKQVCAFGVLTPKVDKLTVGIGMIPRGEVGLIFANIGLGLSIRGVPIITSQTFAVIVIMVIITTMITPPALKWSLSRH